MWVAIRVAGRAQRSQRAGRYPASPMISSFPNVTQSIHYHPNNEGQIWRDAVFAGACPTSSLDFRTRCDDCAVRTFQRAKAYSDLVCRRATGRKES